MKIERRYYTENKKQMQEAEARLKAHYAGMDLEEVQAEMRFYRWASGGKRECGDVEPVWTQPVPSPKRTAHFEELRRDAVYLAEYFGADLVAEDDAARGVIRFEIDRIVSVNESDEVLLSNLMNLIMEADRIIADTVNDTLRLRLFYHLYDEA